MQEEYSRRSKKYYQSKFETYKKLSPGEYFH